MKIFISADLEGINGVAAPEDVEETGSGYQQARVFMTEEVNAVVSSAFAGGATEVVVCDSHNVAANIKVEQLDDRAQLLRGDTRANSMVHGLDESFDGLILLGYHAKFGTQNAILDHTFSPSMIRDLRVNGVSVGELGFNALFAAEKGVPLIMATGDQSLEKEAKDFLPGGRNGRRKICGGKILRQMSAENQDPGYAGGDGREGSKAGKRKEACSCAGLSGNGDYLSAG